VHTMLGDAAHADTLGLVSSSVSTSGCNPEHMDWIRKGKPQPAPELLKALGERDQLERQFGADAGR
jgi:hypothetical protein